MTVYVAGMYCAMLTTVDNVGSHTLSRKFLLFDDQNKVEILTDPDRAIRVESAAANTSFQWITDFSQGVSI